MKLSGIPVIQPVVLTEDHDGFDDALSPLASPQPIIQFKELTVDQVRYSEWKASLRRPNKRRRKCQNP